MLYTVTINWGIREINSFAYAKDHTWFCVSWWLAVSEAIILKNGNHFILDERKEVCSKELNLGDVCTQMFYEFVLLAEGKKKKVFLL